MNKITQNKLIYSPSITSCSFGVELTYVGCATEPSKGWGQEEIGGISFHFEPSVGADVSCPVFSYIGRPFPSGPS